jgi:GAF domain-containing protein
VGEAGAYIREAKVAWDDSQYAQGATGSALRTGEIQVIQDFASNPRVALWADIAKKFGLEACVGLPLRVDGKVFAAFTVYSSQKDAFDKAELAMLERFAEDISFGVQVVRRKEERDKYELQVARLSRFQGALLNAHAAMVRARSEQEIYEGICKVIVENAGYLVAGIGLVQKDAVPAIRPVAVAGGGAHTAEIVQIALMRAREADGSGPVGQAVQSGKVQVIRHRSTDPTLDPWRPRLAALGVTIGATAALPLKRGDEVFGVLAVFSTIEHDFLDDEIVMLESFADDIAFYFDVLRRDGAPS